MPRTWLPSLGLALLLALPAAPALAQVEAEDFVKTLIDAINSKEAAKRMALMHTGSTSCESPGQTQVLEEQFARQSRFPIPGTVAWRLTAARPGKPMFADRFDYPVRPTHLLQLDVKGENNESMYVVLQLARQGGQWREVAGCPKAGTAKVDQRVAAAKAGAEDKAGLLAKTLSPKVKADLLALIKAGRKDDAVRAYRDASAQDAATAQAVIEILEKEAAR
ncbi:MAG TPA: hypothetical protein VFV84_11240 [Burkholderiales bacterium]|nr:hypothetical protein [Burkholderiales bacterium]